MIHDCKPETIEQKHIHKNWQLITCVCIQYNNYMERLHINIICNVEIIQNTVLYTWNPMGVNSQHIKNPITLCSFEDDNELAVQNLIPFQYLLFEGNKTKGRRDEIDNYFIFGFSHGSLVTLSAISTFLLFFLVFCYFRTLNSIYISKKCHSYRYMPFWDRNE